MIVSTNKTPMPFLSEFLTTSFQNVRSSKRTDELHKALLNEILNANPEMAEYRWEFEYQLKEDAFGGTFDIDIVGFDAEGVMKVAILAKALNSNVNKNIKNYANTTVGEAARLYYAPGCNTIEKILFVSVLPRLAPRFNTAGDVVGFDDVISAKNRTKLDDVLSRQYHGTVDTMDLYFDIENVTEQKNKVDYNTINPINLTPMPVV
jgi:hypothetical protein